ncbi:MAG: hypothetical protein MUE78_00775 [Ilumatobacteraceae bacterium]|jgi:hypothetical protein|nr:hypothetical protein [Ilumatobacteraceae bacterium]
MSTDAHHLRDRARALRALATEIERTPAMSLDRHAGPDTWRTPRADLCRAVLRTGQHQLHRAADELRWVAHRLELEAASVEAVR